MRAAQNGNEQAIEKLIEAGANVNAKAANGHTALIEAVIKKNIIAVNALLQVENIDFNAHANDDHLSAREIALKNGDTAIVEAIDKFVALRPQEEKFLPQIRLYQLNAVIDDYHVLRTNEKDEKGD